MQQPHREVAEPPEQPVVGERARRRERHHEHRAHRREHHEPRQAELRVDRARQPGVPRPCPPDQREDQHPAAELREGRILREERRDLREREDEDDVEEQLERRDQRLVRIGADETARTPAPFGARHPARVYVERPQALAEELLLGRVAPELEGVPVRDGGLGRPAQPLQQVGLRRGEVAVAGEAAVALELLHRGQRRLRPLDLGQRHRAVERHHRRRPDPRQLAVELEDLRPVRLLVARRLRVERGDRRLQHEPPGGPGLQRAARSARRPRRSARDPTRCGPGRRAAGSAPRRPCASRGAPRARAAARAARPPRARRAAARRASARGRRRGGRGRRARASPRTAPCGPSRRAGG